MPNIDSIQKKGRGKQAGREVKGTLLIEKKAILLNIVNVGINFIPRLMNFFVNLFGVARKRMEGKSGYEEFLMDLLRFMDRVMFRYTFCDKKF